jgi:hypothetical protein
MNPRTCRWKGRLLRWEGGAVGPSAVPGGAQPERLQLEPCAPNPFPPRAAIRFGLPTSSAVRLCIYDLAGRCAAPPLRSLVPEEGGEPTRGSTRAGV